MLYRGIRMLPSSWHAVHLRHMPEKDLTFPCNGRKPVLAQLSHVSTSTRMGRNSFGRDS